MENTLYTAISFEELQDKFAQIVEDKINNLLKLNSTQEESLKKQYATREEVSERLRISLPTLNSLTKEETITGYRIGRRVLYKWDEIEAALQNIASAKYKRKGLK